MPIGELATFAAKKPQIKAPAEKLVAEVDTDSGTLRRLSGNQLEAFTREELARRAGRRKSLFLLKGTCGFQTAPGGLRITDLAAVTAWLIEAGALERYTEIRRTLDGRKVRDLTEDPLEKTGELLPGVVSVPGRKAFSVKFGKAE